MGISKNRVFDTEQLQTLIDKTQTLMETADTVTKELYSELGRLSTTLGKLPSDLQDSGLKEQVDTLKRSIKTKDFQNYYTSMAKRLKRLKDTIPKEDQKLGDKVEMIAISVGKVTERLKTLKGLIPEGADTGGYADFEKAYNECTSDWSSTAKALNKILDHINASLKGGKNKDVKYSPDPVNLSTGNFIYEKTDLKLAGMPELALTRFYNELDKREGAFGRGWRHPYEVCLLMEEADYTVILEDGKEEQFQKKKDGSFFGEATYSRLQAEVTGYTYRTQEGIRYHFNEAGQYTAWEDRAGNRLLLTYQEEKLTQVLRETDGAYFAFLYDETGQLTAVSDAQGRTVSYRYDPEGRLVQAINAAGEAYIYTYDEAGRIRGVKNPLGTTTVENQYDSKGRTIHQTFPDGGSMSYQYDDEARQVTLTERNESRITYCHNERYQNICTIYEDGEEQFAYNRKGQRILYRDCNGNTTRYAYDSRGNLTQVIDALGVKSNATYDETNQLLKISINGIQQVKNTYDSRGNLMESKDALGRTTVFTYQEKGKPKTITQPDGGTVCFSYDEKGNITGLTDPYENSTTFEYDKWNRVVSATDPRGAKTSYVYDAMNRICRMQTPLGAVIEYAYNQSGKQVEVKRPDGAVLKTEYNSLNRPSVVTDAMGNRVMMTYDAMWNVSGIQTDDGAKESYEYNGRNRLSAITDVLGGCTEYGYDSNGNKIWEKGPEGEEIRYVYDAANRLSAVTDALGNTTSYTYNHAGNLTAITDALGNVTSIAYDDAGQKISETDALGNTTSYTYTLLGEVETITDPEGRIVKYEYQTGGRVSGVYYPDGTWEKYQYDAVGNLIEKRNSQDVIVTCTYDIENRLVSRSIQKGPEEKFQYDIMGNLISQTDAAGNQTKYTYDKNGNITCVEDALGNQTKYEYNTANHLIKVLKEGQIEKAYDRNLLGQVETVWDALGEKETFRYDKSGRKTEVLDRDGYRTSYGYNKNGALKEIQYNDGRSVSYTYNPLGHLVQMKDWLGTTLIKNNALGQVLHVTGPDEKTVAYSYGKTGERRSMTYPDGKTVYYGYDDALRLTSLSKGDQVLSYAYDENSRLKEKVLPNGVHTQYQYTALGQLEEINSHGAKGLLEHFRYEYDVLGNRIKEEKERKDLSQENGIYTYGYDPLGRLQEVKKEQELLRRYQYDGRGNRTQMLLQEAGVQKETRYQYNLLEQLETETSNGIERKYRYDGRGNLTQVLENGKEQHHYQYGALNRMEKAVDAQGKTAEYQYSGLGFRTGRTENANQISYVLDLTREYHNLLYCQQEDKETSFLWDNGAALLETEGNVTSYISDSLGSPLRLLDEMGEVEESYGYDEFGCDLYGNSGQTQPFGFAGYEADKVSGTSFAQAREYQPETGRFVSEDPIKGFIEHPITLNHYAYCFNNPLILVDYNGAWPSLSDIKSGISNACGAVADVAKDLTQKVKNTIESVDWKTVGKVVATGVVIAAAATVAVMATAATGGAAIAVVAAVGGGALIGGVSGGIKNEMNGKGFLNGFCGGMMNGAITTVGYMTLQPTLGSGVGGAVGTAATDIMNNMDNVDNPEEQKSTVDILLNSVGGALKAMIITKLLKTLGITDLRSAWGSNITISELGKPIGRAFGSMFKTMLNKMSGSIYDIISAYIKEEKDKVECIV